MTDKKFQQLLDNVTKAQSRYESLLMEAEKEYKRRFGNHPSDIEDDFWIDSFRVCAEGAKVEEVIESAKLYNAQSS